MRETMKTCRDCDKKIGAAFNFCPKHNFAYFGTTGRGAKADAAFVERVMRPLVAA